MQGFLARSSSLSAVERIAAKRREERLRATDPTAMSAEAMDLRAALLDAHALRGRACRKAAAAKRAFDAEKELERRWHYENLVENTRLTTEMGAMRAANGRLVDEVRQLRAFVEAARKGDVREREAVARRRRNKWAEATRLASANADQRPGLNLWRPPRPPSPRSKWPAAAVEAPSAPITIARAAPLLRPLHLREARMRKRARPAPPPAACAAAPPRLCSPDPRPWG